MRSISLTSRARSTLTDLSHTPEEFCPIDDAARQLLGTAMRQMQLSARAYHCILKLARTIADLAGEERIRAAPIVTAILMRLAVQV